jgi:hypothetical protein
MALATTAVRLIAFAPIVLALSTSASFGASCSLSTTFDTSTKTCYTYIAALDFGATNRVDQDLTSSNERSSVVFAGDVVPLPTGLTDERFTFDSLGFGLGDDNDDFGLKLVSNVAQQQALAWATDAAAIRFDGLGPFPTLLDPAGDYLRLFASVPVTKEEVEAEAPAGTALPPAVWFSAGLSGIGLIALRRQRYGNRHQLGRQIDAWS